MKTIKLIGIAVSVALASLHAQAAFAAGIDATHVENGGQRLAGARLLLADGHVLSIDEQGKLADERPVRLDIGPATAEIYSVDVDFEMERIYVVPERVDGVGETRMFHLATLKFLGVLPGVTEVVIPKDRSSDVFITKRYAPIREGASVSGLREAHDNSASSMAVELRSRGRPEVITAAMSGQDVAATDFSCFVSAETGFRMISANVLLDQSLTRKTLDSGAPWSKLDARPGGCWPDGTTWLQQRSPSQPGAFLGQIDLVTAALVSLATFRAPDGFKRGNTTAFELGLKPEGLVLMTGGDVPIAAGNGGFLLVPGTPEPVQLAPSVFADIKSSGFEGLTDAGSSVSQGIRYLVPSRQRAGGQLLMRDDRLFRLKVSDERPLEELKLPEEIVLLNAIEDINLDDGKSAEEKRGEIAALGELPATLQGIGQVQIFYVLPSERGGPEN